MRTLPARTDSGYYLGTLAGSAKDDVWAASYVVIPGARQIDVVRWDGISWKTSAFIALATDEHVLAIGAYAKDDAWAITTAGKIAQWGGTSWRLVTTVRPAVRATWAGPGDVWVDAPGGGGIPYHYAGGVASDVPWSTIGITGGPRGNIWTYRDPPRMLLRLP